MNNNKLIFIIALSFSLLVNIPRIIFLFGNGGDAFFFEVSIKDTIFRVISLLGFCLIILKLNINADIQFFTNKKAWKTYLLNFLVFICWMLLFRVFDAILNAEDSSTLSPRFNNFVYFFVMLMLIIISRTILLNNQSKKDAVEKEILKRQSLQNELSALKNQVNPHFLFNSLNSLTLLVREDQKSAEKFISKLSFLYRTILQSNNEDLVSINDELVFLDSYIYLIKQRYRDNFKTKINIKESLLQKKVPSLALQLLVENAVKHNEISIRNPLLIEIYTTDDFLVVKNKLQKRTGVIEGTNTGLKNLNIRSKLLLSKEIIIKHDPDNFIVKLPII